MAKFGGKKKKDTPGMNTAALPDIVFMLLFFFMVATVMRENSLKIQDSETLVMVRLPKASEITKLKKKNLVKVINVGKPTKKYLSKYGDASRIQLDDVFGDKEDVREWIEKERASMPQKLQKKMNVSLKVDKETKMGIVSDVKQELRKANALKINYNAITGEL